MMKNTIGNNIRKYRMRNGWNQDALALQLNLKRQTISSYERGISLPDIYILLQLAKIFQVELEDLVESVEFDS